MVQQTMQYAMQYKFSEEQCQNTNTQIQYSLAVSARKERPNFIIEADFLAAHNSELSLCQKLLMIGEQSIQCFPEYIRANSVKLKVARRIQLPPQTEVLVNCKATPGIKYFGVPHAVEQLADNSWRYAEDGLVIGSSLNAPDCGTHYLPVMNLLDALCTKGPGLGRCIQSPP